MRFLLFDECYSDVEKDGNKEENFTLMINMEKILKIIFHENRQIIILDDETTVEIHEIKKPQDLKKFIFDI